MGVHQIDLESSNSLQWTATSRTSWIEVITESGTSPGRLEFLLDTGALGLGNYEGTITLSDGEQSWDYPISITVAPRSFQHVEYDEQGDRLFAISQDERALEPDEKCIRVT